MNTPSPTSEYLLLFRGSDDWDQFLSPAELQKTVAGFLAWFERLNAEGTLKAGQPLLDDARIVSGINGRIVADGPFAESKEAVGGYFLIKADDLDHAVAIAQQCPMLEYGLVIEVRPIASECAALQRSKQVVETELAPASV